MRFLFQHSHKRQFAVLTAVFLALLFSVSCFRPVPSPSAPDPSESDTVSEKTDPVSREPSEESRDLSESAEEPSDFSSPSVPLPSPSPDDCGLIISEIMSRNSCFPVAGRLCDWIELCNGGDDPVNLSHFCLTDREEEPFLCDLPPMVLDPREYAVFPCGGSVLSFSLGRSGDTVMLFEEDGELIDTVTFGEIGENMSFTPEGITDRFFSAFFSGRDQEAWGLLTEKAQNATKENFVAQASDTVGWEITKKSVEDGMAYVFVNVSDLTDTGDRATEELIFALRSDNGRWGVAGFSAGTLAVNFEETAVESYNAQNDLPAVEPERVSQMPGAEEIR